MHSELKSICLKIKWVWCFVLEKTLLFLDGMIEASVSALLKTYYYCHHMVCVSFHPHEHQNPASSSIMLLTRTSRRCRFLVAFLAMYWYVTVKACVNTFHLALHAMRLACTKRWHLNAYIHVTEQCEGINMQESLQCCHSVFPTHLKLSPYPNK